MCGIAGIFNLKDTPIDAGSFKNAVKCLSHRGPDDEGIFLEENIGLGHRRLSILDLSPAGHQPMFSADGRWVIVYNGEVYNFKELQSALEKKGHSFKSHSDTEVILHAYMEWGNSCFTSLNGMFAIAIFDRLEKKLNLARDRFGIKPLYYYKSDDYFVFASEIKSILATNLSERKVNYQGLSEYIWYGNPMGKNTLFKDIWELLPGHLLEIYNGQVKEKCFYNFSEIKIQEQKEEVAISKIQKLLEEAVQRHLISDVPVGIFLSGGIDSSAITALASRHYGGKLQTYSVGFDYDKGVNELQKAASVAKQYNTDHHELHITANDLIPVIEKLVACHDEPFADAANIPLFLLSREIKDKIKVVLQGDGGDEIFGGYSRYNTLQNMQKWRRLAPLMKLIPTKISYPSVLRAKRFVSAISEKDEAVRNALLLTMESRSISPEKIFTPEIQRELQKQDPFRRYKEIYASFNGTDIMNKMFMTDTRIILPDTFLEKVDKSTMANGLEVRVPFLDTELTNYAMSLPGKMKVKNGEKKYLLKKALRGIVPDDILDAPKTGFGVPYSFWLQDKLNNYLKERLNLFPQKESYIFSKPLMEKMLSLHTAGKGYYGFLLWKSLQLAIWIDLYKVSF